MPGLASATGTRVDSAAKHNLACRVAETLMMTWCEDQGNARNHLHNQKMKYCMHKSELALNVSQALNNCSTLVAKNRAYPAVVSTLGDMTMQSKDVLMWLYHESGSGRKFLENKDLIRKEVGSSAKGPLRSKVMRSTDVGGEHWQRICRELRDLPYFTAQGYSLGIAYASNLTGDTVATVMIGGMQTVQNGAFDCRAGQMLQWYFDFEADMFYRDNTEDRKTRRSIAAGTRKNRGTNDGLDKVIDMGEYRPDPSDENRLRFYERELGDTKTFPKNYQKRCIFYPKPYMLTTDGEDHYADKIRIFAKCINGGRRHEMIDIMLMTQSL